MLAVWSKSSRLRISNAQLQAFVARKMQMFRYRLRVHLSAHFPEAAPQTEYDWDELLDFGLRNAQAATP